jgi:Domain of unknown function (DUF1906)
MTKRTLRNALTLVIAALSASIEAPRLARQPLSAAAELADVPAAIGDAVERAASNVSESHLGFDTNIYPGDKAMAAWKNAGEYEWVGYYLKAPCHSDNSWLGTRERLVNQGWGLAVIYVGQQTWGKNLSLANAPTTVAAHARAKHVKASKKSHKKSRTRTMTRRSSAPVATAGSRCSASYVNAIQGAIDAQDAIATTAREGFPKGTVVFLDVEHMDVVPPAMREYYKAWARVVLADGRYQPGIYAHTKNAKVIYDDVSDVYDQAGVDAEPPFWIAGSSGFSPGSAPTDVGHAFASAWQGVLDVVRTHNGVRLPIDISVASAASPSLASVQ